MSTPPTSARFSSHIQLKFNSSLSMESNNQPLYNGGRAGRPAAGRPGGPAAPQPGDRPQGPVCNFFIFFFAEKPLPPGCRAARSRSPGSGAAGVYFCKFPNQKYIFVKNGNKNIKIKKPLYLKWFRSSESPLKKRKHFDRSPLHFF